MADLDRIRARIRQLREMTQANGCTEAEALSAAEKALELMGRHGISEDELERTTSTRPGSRKRRSVCHSLWLMVAAVCRCRTYWDGTSRQYHYYGAPADVMVAEYLHDILLGAVKRASAEFKRDPEYRRRRKPGTRAAALRTFQIAMIKRLTDRLNSLWWLRVREDRALQEAEIGHLNALQAELERRLPLVRSRPLKGHGGHRFTGSAVAGWFAGGAVPIDPAVDGGEEERRQLGHG